MDDAIDKSIELLETAYADRDWDLVLEVIRQLNQIPQITSDSEEEGEGYEIDE